MGIIGICTVVLLLAGLAWCSVLAGAGAGWEERVFNVEDFGARGDGTTDDTEAFVRAWAAACGAMGTAASTLLVPAAKIFVVGPTKFSGPCASTRITVQVMGTILAQPAFAWTGQNYWLMFYRVDGLTVTGSGGVLDGRGQTWWSDRCKDDEDCILEAPTALYLMNCTNAELSHLSSKDSPQMHIAVSMSWNVNVTQLTITAPGDSPNTDGVHVDRSEGGPGHGVSVGSLGRNGANERVEHIDVRNVHFINTMNGARIKTWQGGQGYARSISFTNVDHPVVIDQFYQDRDVPITGAVALSDITYTNLKGTSSRRTAVAFDCSNGGSCTEIHVNYMAITGSDGRETIAHCRNAQGDTSGYVCPIIPCLIG